MELDSAVRKLNRIERDTLLITVGAVVLSGIVFRSWEFMAGLLLGGLLMLLNFHFLWRFTRRALEKDNRRKAAYLAGIFFLFFLFLGAVSFLLLVAHVPLIPFFLGTLALVASIFLNGVFFS